MRDARCTMRDVERGGERGDGLAVVLAPLASAPY